MLDPKFVRRGLFLVFLILFLDVIGIAIIMPVLPAYLEELTGGTISDAALDGGWLLVVYAGMLFLFSPLLGNLSDRFGRRPILLLSVLTFAIDNLICAAATSFWMLFIGRALAGFSGGSYATCSAYIADISNDGNRAKNFGLIGIAFGVGFTIGPVIGGLLGEFGPRVPFFGAAALSFLNFAAAYFLLPETLDAKHRRTFEWKRANPLGALKQMRNYPGIGWVGAVMFLFWLAHAVYPSVWSFVSTYRYGWSEGQIGLSLGIYGIGAAIVMGLVLPKIVPVLGEWKTAIVGLCFSAVGLTGYAFAWEGWVVYTVIILHRDGKRRRSAASQHRRRQGAAIRAGRTTGSADQPQQHYDDRRPADLHADVRLFHSAGCSGDLCRCSLPARCLLYSVGGPGVPREGPDTETSLGGAGAMSYQNS